MNRCVKFGLQMEVRSGPLGFGAFAPWFAEEGLSPSVAWTLSERQSGAIFPVPGDSFSPAFLSLH